MSIIQGPAVAAYLDAMNSETFVYTPSWEDWLAVGPPYPDVPFDKKRVFTRFNRNGYDWDINGQVYTPEREVDPAIAWVVTLGTNGSEGECDVTPDGRPGLAPLLAAQGFKVMTLTFPGHYHPPDGIWPMAVAERKPHYVFDQELSDAEIADRALKCTFDTNMQGVAKLLDEHLGGRGIVVTNGTLGCRVPVFLEKCKVVGHTTIGFAGCDAWRASWRERTGSDLSFKEFPIDDIQRKSPDTHRNSGYHSDDMLAPWGSPDAYVAAVSPYRSQLKPSLTVNQHEGDVDVIMKYVERTGLPRGEYFDYLDEPDPKTLKDLGVLVFVGMNDKKHWIFGDDIEDKREVYMARQFAKHSKKVNVIPVPHYGHIAMNEGHNEKFVYHWLWSHKDGYFKP